MGNFPIVVTVAGRHTSAVVSSTDEDAPTVRGMRTKLTSPQRSPTDWWRAIGDTNLRLLRSLSLVVHPMNGHQFHGVSVSYHKPLQKVSCVNWDLCTCSVADEEGQRRLLESMTRSGIDADTMLAVHLRSLKENGPHVGVLEGIVGDLKSAGRETST